jgi:hypothetical protein
MDEVDFTILAATSVLGDLVDKCPPAEACRDAFDRMSKATVQMCMSTTGFSSSAQSLNSPHRIKGETGANNADYFSASSTQFATSNARSQKSGKHRQHSNEHQKQQVTGRPKPSFDMGLNDLFPIPGPNAGLQTPGGSYPSSNNGSYVAPKKEAYANEAFGIPISQMHSPSDYAISPVQTQSRPTSHSQTQGQGSDTSAIDPSLLPSPQGALPHASLPQSTATYDPSMLYSQQPAGSFTDMNFGLGDMDFLQGNVSGPSNGAMGAENGQGGLDLGFGLGWEGMDHDFSEGNQLDLFDGFFFGGTGGGF